MHPTFPASCAPPASPVCHSSHLCEGKHPCDPGALACLSPDSEWQKRAVFLVDSRMPNTPLQAATDNRSWLVRWNSFAIPERKYYCRWTGQNQTQQRMSAHRSGTWLCLHHILQGLEQCLVLRKHPINTWVSEWVNESYNLQEPVPCLQAMYGEGRPAKRRK